MGTNDKRWPLNERGVTLVELMIVMVLSLLLVGTAFLSYNLQAKVKGEQQDIIQAQQELRGVMNVIEQDIQLAGCDPKQVRIEPLVFAAGTSSDGSSLYMQLDRDGDGNDSSLDDNVAYLLENNELKRWYFDVSGEPENRVVSLTSATVLLEGVQNLSFVYRDKKFNDIGGLLPGSDNNTQREVFFDKLQCIEVTIELKTEEMETPRNLTRTVVLRNTQRS